MFIDSIEKSALIKKNQKDQIKETKSEMFIDSIEKSALIKIDLIKSSSIID